MAVTEQAAVYTAPGTPASPVELKPRYDNFIGGHWVPPAEEEYSQNPTPATGKPFCKVPRSTPHDIDLALDAAREAWARRRPRSALQCSTRSPTRSRRTSRCSPSRRAGRTANRSVTLAADIPLAVDHFRYFAGAISEIDKETVVYHFREPLAVVSAAQGVRFRGVAALGRRAPGGRRG
jgi:aldehyde dehydrogenase